MNDLKVTNNTKALSYAKQSMVIASNFLRILHELLILTVVMEFTLAGFLTAVALAITMTITGMKSSPKESEPEATLPRNGQGCQRAEK